MSTLKKIMLLTAPALLIGGAVLLSSSEAQARPHHMRIAKLRHACVNLGHAYSCRLWRRAVRRHGQVYVAPTPRVYHRRYQRTYRPHRIVQPYRSQRWKRATQQPRRAPAVHHRSGHRQTVHKAPARRSSRHNQARSGGNGRRGRRGQI